jgi:DNA-binding transcriptional LysR family regulator
MLAEGLDLRKLRAFQLVARQGGLRAAARRLRITIPAASFLIRKLEHELGVELFQRLPQGLVLTHAGENLLRASSIIFEDVEGALATIGEQEHLEGQFSISTSGDSIAFFTPRITAFIKRYPRLEIRHNIHTSAYTLRLVHSGTVDVGVGEFSKIPSGIAKEVVIESGLSLLCTEDSVLCHKSPVRLTELAQTRIILPTQSSTRKAVDLAFSRAGTKYSDLIETNGCHTARDFVRSGLGAAIVHSVCASRLSMKGVRQIDMSAQFHPIEFSIIYRKEASRSPLIRAFVDELISTGRGLGAHPTMSTGSARRSSLGV